MSVNGTKESKTQLIMSTKVNEFLCEVILKSLDVDLLNICLDDIFLLLEFGEWELNQSIIKKDFENQGLIDKFNKLTNHVNKEISDKAMKIVEAFWS